MTSTDPRHGFPTFQTGARAQRQRQGRQYPNRLGKQAREVSRMLAQRVCRGEGTFTR